MGVIKCKDPKTGEWKPFFNFGSGGTSIDVTAQVGQTIVVKNVDENGKPTEWEAVDYQPRTHWIGEKVIFDEFTCDLDGGRNSYVGAPSIGLIEGKTYTVMFDNVPYARTAVAARVYLDADTYYDGIWLGNPYVYGGEYDGTPFFIGDATSEDAWAVMFLDGGEHTISIIDPEGANPVPQEYMTNAFPFYIEARADCDEYLEHEPTNHVFITSAESAEKAFLAGREIKLRVKLNNSERFPAIYTLACAGKRDGRMEYLFTMPASENGGAYLTVLAFTGNCMMYYAIAEQEDGTLGLFDW